ncbi:MAG: DTW domain-containing protein [endosymbiont of Galathealinum brachiosum]|uniref:tRNA-uridine aminocarboxypropyltransferase n=1 Tax=endosymbiont of Galathealinum brachiosum TaxID=2200906 RepID=A0A370DMS9_9GAMM|nr:MAG: DTW domain-containing protein [endosymbiont of Galathealinum brachiosum]
MQFILLTHSREISKKTNTGQLVQQLIPDTQIIIWQRTQPDKKLLQLIKSGATALVYPAEETTLSVDPQSFENFILIDGTWQEARKIYNRSPYLHPLPRVQLSSEKVSNYSLRRNQIEGGLCTVECVAELLRENSCSGLADELDVLFHQFMAKI